MTAPLKLNFRLPYEIDVSIRIIRWSAHPPTSVEDIVTLDPGPNQYGLKIGDDLGYSRHSHLSLPSDELIRWYSPISQLSGDIRSNIVLLWMNDARTIIYGVYLACPFGWETLSTNCNDELWVDFDSYIELEPAAVR